MSWGLHVPSVYEESVSFEKFKKFDDGPRCIHPPPRWRRGRTQPEEDPLGDEVQAIVKEPFGEF